jgi:hypothetical protein
MATDRPHIGAIVQQLSYTGAPGYTGIVTRHDATSPRFYVEWHKWGNKDDESLWGWEYSMNQKRIVDTPQPREWWPIPGTREGDIHGEYLTAKARIHGPNLLSMTYEGGTILAADKRGYIAIVVTSDDNIIELMGEIGSGSGDFTGTIIESLVGLMHHYIVIQDPDIEDDIYDYMDEEIVQWVLNREE